MSVRPRASPRILSGLFPHLQNVQMLFYMEASHGSSRNLRHIQPTDVERCPSRRVRFLQENKDHFHKKFKQNAAPLVWAIEFLVAVVRVLESAQCGLESWLRPSLAV